jgi:hypothetical protein
MRFAQRAARKQTPVAEAKATVEDQQLHVAMQAVVREAVVEHQDLRTERGDGPLACHTALLAHQHRHTGRVGREEHRLVSRLRDAGEHVSAVGDHHHLLVGSPPVAAAGDRHPVTAPAQLPGNERGGGGLAGTADHQTAHAHDAATETHPPQDRAPVQEAMGSGARPVEQRREVQR